VPRLPRIANFDDLDPLRQEPAVRVDVIPLSEALPEGVDLVLLPGSKATIADLLALREAGWEIDIKAHRRRGGHVLGLCGGYQMLGRAISDPDGLEGPAGRIPGLRLLDVETVLAGPTLTAEVAGIHVASGAPVAGSRIPLGRTAGPDGARPFVRLDGSASASISGHTLHGPPLASGRHAPIDTDPRPTIASDAAVTPDGAVSPDGRVAGTYLHGLFAGDGFRRVWLSGFGATATLAFEAGIDRTLDALADHLEAHLDVARILEIAGRR
jgi:adenosylcobyric acid synthase